MTEDPADKRKRTVAEAFTSVARPTVGKSFLGGPFKPVFSKTKLDDLSEAGRQMEQAHTDLMASITRDVEDRDKMLARIAKAERERQEAQDQRETEMLTLTRQSVEVAKIAVFVALIGVALACVAIVVAIALA